MTQLLPTASLLQFHDVCAKARDFYRANPRSRCDTRIWLEDTGALGWATVESSEPHRSMDRITFPLASFNRRYPNGIGFCVQPGAEYLIIAFRRAIETRIAFHKRMVAA